MLSDSDIICCSCQGKKTPHPICAGTLRLDENGVKVQLKPRVGESAQLIIMDGCFCSAKGKKCDALYLLQQNSIRQLLTVELKGTHVEDAVEQLADTLERDEYKRVKRNFSILEPIMPLREYSFVLSHQSLGSLDLKRLRQARNFKLRVITTSKGTGKMTDLRRWL